MLKQSPPNYISAWVDENTCPIHFRFPVVTTSLCTEQIVLHAHIAKQIIYYNIFYNHESSEIKKGPFNKVVPEYTTFSNGRLSMI